MRNRILRVVVLVAAVTGLLALLSDPAMAFIENQHCEPLLRR